MSSFKINPSRWRRMRDNSEKWISALERMERNAGGNRDTKSFIRLLQVSAGQPSLPYQVPALRVHVAFAACGCLSTPCPGVENKLLAA